MSLEVSCGKCGARFTLPDDLYERRVRGRLVTVRCKKCRADIAVDGTKLDGADASRAEPASGPSSLPAVEGLWVVSYGENDDRELTVAQIRRALERGEIDRDTLVWNTSLDEWRTIAEVPALAGLVPADQVGGFLGTGLAVESDVDLLGEDEVGPFRSVGPGTMREVSSDAPSPRADSPRPSGTASAAEGTPTAPLAATPAKDTKPDEPGPDHRPSQPPKKLPTAPPKVRPAWLSEPPPEPPAGVDPDLPEGEEAAPSSGTPDLRTLMAAKTSTSEQGPAQDDAVSEDIFAIGGGGIATALAPIDLSSIGPPPPSSRKPREEEAPASSAPPRADKKRSTTPRRPRTTSSEASRPPAKKEPEQRGSPATWFVLAAAGAFAVYWFFLRAPDAGTPAEPTSRPTPEPRVVPTPMVAPASTPAATSAPVETGADAAGAGATSQAQPATSDDKPAAKDDKPAAKDDKPAAKDDKPAAKDDKPAPESGGDVAMAPPFDANAARAALASAAAAAAGCRKEGDPAGTATVVVTFAPSGRVTTANLTGPPFAGTPTGSCIAAALRSAKVPPFSGDRVTVSKTVVIQ